MRAPLGLFLLAGSLAGQTLQFNGLAAHRPPAPQQVSGLNLDFAYIVDGAPQLWSLNPGPSSEYDFLMDSTVTYAGKPGFRIRSLGAQRSDLGYAYLYLPVSLLRGQTLHFSGAIRTAGPTGLFASLGMASTDVTGKIISQTLIQPQPAGISDWQMYSISTPITANIAAVRIAVVVQGAGTAWFANLSADVDGVPIALPAAVPLPNQVEWLKTNAFPFTSLDAGAGDAELAPLEGLIGNARIVGLGEGTHGSSEFFRMKSRIISYLARHMGFTVFAIEASLPEAYLMNNYVLNGVGDPKALLTGMYFWTWNTQEVLDMIQWMRQFNASGQGRIEFLGFDMQYPAVAMNNVASFVAQADPASMSFLSASYATVAQVAEFVTPTADQSSGGIAAAQAVWQRLSDNRAAYVQTQPASAVDFAVENASIVVQALTYRQSLSGAYRDAQMAANIQWIASQHPNERIVLWAHDQHINKVPGLMGGYLGQTFGADYVALGALFYGGSFNALNSSGELAPNVAQDSIPGCVEYFFHQTGVPRQILDTRLANVNADLSSWLTDPLWVRTIGSTDVPGFYLTPPYAKAYDGIVFFDQVTPSVLLPFPFTISSASLPSGAVGVIYFQNLISTYGTAEGVTWQASGTVPPGLSLAADGALSGTPQSAGTYRFNVTASSNGFASPSAAITLTIGQ